LKSLDSAKEIQGKLSLFLGLPLRGLGPVWPRLAKFGMGFDAPLPIAPPEEPETKMKGTTNNPAPTSKPLTASSLVFGNSQGAFSMIGAFSNALMPQTPVAEGNGPRRMLQ
jgi:hypothetical protein